MRGAYESRLGGDFLFTKIFYCDSLVCSTTSLSSLLTKGESMRKRSVNLRHAPSVAKEIIDQIGLTHEEIAKRCYCAVTTIKSWVRDGIPECRMRKLRVILEEVTELNRTKSPTAIVTLNVSVDLSNPNMDVIRKVKEFLRLIES